MLSGALRGSPGIQGPPGPQGSPGLAVSTTTMIIFILQTCHDNENTCNSIITFWKKIIDLPNV